MESMVSEKKDKLLPISDVVKAERHTPVYQMHKYFARRPHNVFRHLIQYYSNPGEVVLDCFCGGGVTIFESLASDRKVIGCDLNPLATFITQMQILKIDTNELKSFLFNFIDSVENDLNDIYKTPENNLIEWTEWAYTIKCPVCGEIIILSNDNKLTPGKFKCSNANCKGHKLGIKRTEGTPLSSVPLSYKLIGDETIYNYNDNQKEFIINKIEKYNIDTFNVNPDTKIPENWDRQIEDCLNVKGIYNFSDLFTKRNYFVNLYIFNKILELKNKPNFSEEYLDCLYFVFSSTIRYTNNMTRVTANWEGGKPTSMDKHAYWLPNQYIETNVFNVFRKRINSALKGWSYTNEQITNEVFAASNFKELLNANYMILNQDSSSLPIPDKSIDVVITDPPYGSNVQYSELSSIWNIWYKMYAGLNSYIYKEGEAVVNRKQNFDGSKDIKDYENALYRVFKECNRVLKDDAYLVFTFNNKDIRIWLAILSALVKAGFYLPEGGIIFQDFIQSYKNTSHLKFSGNIHGDFIYSFKKCNYNDYCQKIIKHDLYSSIDECIVNLYKNNDKYSTPELYRFLFSTIVQTMINLILYQIQNPDDKTNISYDDMSSDFVDTYLKQTLIYKDGYWYKK